MSIGENSSKRSSKKPKVRNYSFKNSKRLPVDKMTKISGVRVPSMPGSCYHAVICALAQNKDSFTPWHRIVELTEKYMLQYGGEQAWDKFRNKTKVKSYQQRIKDNTHTLTRTGKDCYGFRLHEQGMAIYFFKDGAILITGGTFVQDGESYDVIFPDARGLQVRYRGTTMTSREYKKFLAAGHIDKSGRILNVDGIKKLRSGTSEQTPRLSKEDKLHICVTLSENYDQDTARRLSEIGFVVEEAHDHELIGMIDSGHLDTLKRDKDVVATMTAG